MVTGRQRPRTVEESPMHDVSLDRPPAGHRPRTRLVAWTLALLVVAGAASAGLALFQPWRLFTTRTVDEAAPGVTLTPTGPPSASTSPTADAAAPGASSTAPAAAPRVVAAGSFRSLAHETTGDVTLVRLADGSLAVRIVDLATSDGPDVRVWLSDRPVESAGEADQGRWLELGPLRGNRGALTYPVPAGTDAGDYASLVIWCKRFSVGFGAAPLNPT
jgi:hypothetical protein